MVEKSLVILANNIVNTIEREDKKIDEIGYKEKIKAKDFLKRFNNEVF